MGESETTYLREAVKDLKEALKENRAELKTELNDLRSEVSKISEFVNEAKGGKALLFGALSIAVSLGAIITYFFKH